MGRAAACHGNAVHSAKRRSGQSKAQAGWVWGSDRKNQGPASRAMLLIVWGGVAGLQAENVQASGGLAQVKGWCRVMCSCGAKT